MKAIFQRRGIITAGLADQTHGVRSDVLDALEAIAVSPTDPDGVRVSPARGRAAREGADLIAHLPHNFFLAFRYYDSAPPLNVPVIQVLSFMQRVLPE